MLTLKNLLSYRLLFILWTLSSNAFANERVFINGTIYTVNPKQPWAEAVHINNGMIEFVGDNATALANASENATITNLPSNNGLNYFSQNRLANYIRALPDFDFHIHTIGDRGVHEALNAIQTAQRPNARHRLTHLEIVNRKDYPRFTQLNVTADMQVAGDFTQPDHWPEARPLIGSRANKLVPLKDLHQANARITLSSDWDVSTLNPFVGIQNALTRTPQNLPDLAAAIQAYTLNGAYVMRQETITGSIETGKQADLIVLDQNIFDLPVQKIHQTQVLMTILNGKIIYQWSEQNG